MKEIKYQCPYCDKVHTLAAVTARGMTYIFCAKCRRKFDLSPKTWVEPNRGVTENQRRSRDQEKRAAKRDGGRVRPASGAMSGAKGDVHNPGLSLMECKETTAKSFSVKRATLEKVCSEAGVEETPVLEVEFQDQHPYMRVYVLPEWAWQEYMELKSVRANQND